jgi:hypothetical protein
MSSTSGPRPMLCTIIGVPDSAFRPRDDADVRQVPGQHPGHQVASHVRVRVADRLPSGAVPQEEGLQGRDTSMVDVRIWASHAPRLRVGTKGLEHVLVHLYLQVNPDRAVGPDDDVRANANRGGYVAARVGYPPIRAVILDTGRSLGDRSSHQAICERDGLAPTRTRGRSEDCGDNREHPTHLVGVNVTW